MLLMLLLRLILNMLVINSYIVCVVLVIGAENFKAFLLNLKA